MKRSYIGFTVTPQRRIRQHNGEIVNGAKKTLPHRPWEMVLVVYGFPTKELALQCKFEWVWQHPYNSRFTKSTMGHLKTDKSLGNMRCIQRKIRELHLILNLPPWSQLELILSYTSQEMFDLGQSLDAFQLPSQMRIVMVSLDELPASHDTHEEDQQTTHDCTECSEPIAPDQPMLQCYHLACPMKAHVPCLSSKFTLLESSVPHLGTCSICNDELVWPRLLELAVNPTESKKRKPSRRERTRRKKARATSKQAKRQTRTKNGSEEESADEVASASPRSSVDHPNSDHYGWENHEVVEILSSTEEEALIPSENGMDEADLTPCEIDLTQED
ncbi:hypothetical protein LEN26_014075 [Aphanomyces euteiches]|nr:hypothetical protein AeMF1_021476 [Aphanomyces euteiches]KAH9108955.1 hypothetical protein LEN26_014075 [Aphanomyces euteiches]KAH9196922.1 hypothetical protein AeNC1_001125 [Aphanomyces euteiches]